MSQRRVGDSTDEIDTKEVIRNGCQEEGYEEEGYEEEGRCQEEEVRPSQDLARPQGIGRRHPPANPRLLRTPRSLARKTHEKMSAPAVVPARRRRPLEESWESEPARGRFLAQAAVSAVRNAREGFGPHLVFDGYGCPTDLLGDIDRIYTLLDSLPDRIRMTKIMPPYVFRHAAPGRGGEGLSGFVLIAESHIAVHTFPRRHFLNVDVFSCQTFDVESVLAAFKESFVPRRVEWKLLDRGLEFPKTIGVARTTVLQNRVLVAREFGLEASR